MALIRCAMAIWIVVGAVIAVASETHATTLAKPTPVCADVTSYLDAIKVISTALKQQGEPADSFPADWREMILHPERYQSKPLIAASNQFVTYATDLAQITAPEPLRAFQSTRVDLMRDYASQSLAVAQRGVYAATIWNSTIASDTKRALKAETTVIDTCPDFADRFDAVDYFGLISGANGGTPVASPAY